MRPRIGGKAHYPYHFPTSLFHTSRLFPLHLRIRSLLWHLSTYLSCDAHAGPNAFRVFTILAFIPSCCMKMEKDIATEPQPLGRPKSMDETPRKPSPEEDARSLDRHDSNGQSDISGGDLEDQNADGLGLSRTVSSGPPYTIYNHKTKMFILASVSVSSLISPFGATTFYPALNTLADQLNVTPTMVNLSLTTYMVPACHSPSLENTPLTRGLDCPSSRPIHPRWDVRFERPTALLPYLLHHLYRRQYRARAANQLRRPPCTPHAPSHRVQRRYCLDKCRCRGHRYVSGEREVYGLRHSWLAHGSSIWTYDWRTLGPLSRMEKYILVSGNIHGSTSRYLCVLLPGNVSS